MAPTPRSMPQRLAMLAPASASRSEKARRPEPENPLRYRAILPPRTHAQELFSESRASFSEWLTSKGIDTQLSSGIHNLPDDRTLIVTDSYDASGRPSALRLRLREDRTNGPDGGVWQTTLTAAMPDGGLMGVDVERFEARREVMVQAPRLVRILLTHFHVDDGDFRLGEKPLRIQVDDCSNLAAALINPTRVLPLIVAVAPLDEPPAWDSMLERVARGVTGIAVVLRLTAVAAMKFGSAVSERFDVRPGQVRTYLPGIDPDFEYGHRSHRFVTARTLSEERYGKNAEAILSRQPFRLSAQRSLPPLLSAASFPGIRDTLDSLASDREITEPVAVGEDLDALREQLHRANTNFDRVVGQLREAYSDRVFSEKTRIALEHALREIEGKYEDEVVDHDEDQQELSQLRSEAAELRRRLVESERPDQAYAPIEMVEVPKSFDALNGRVSAEMPHVLFTYDCDVASELDDDIKGSTWASKAWISLTALESYGKYRSDGALSSNFLEFCRNVPPGGKGCPFQRISMVESEKVRTVPKQRRERILPVPPEVDKSGKIFMESHIKLDSKGSRSPRIYFYDDTKGVTGKVIVGYIGPHMTNSHTN